MSCTHGCCDSQATHYRSIRFGKGEGADKDKTFDADQWAFKRLTENNLQPPTVVGAAELERKAQSAVEVETGKIIPDKRLRKGLEEVRTYT